MRAYTYRRSPLEIHYKLLKILSVGDHKPTNVMEKAGMCYKSLMRHFQVLEDKNLIKSKASDVEDARVNRLYFITNKGVMVLKILRETDNMYGLLDTTARMTHFATKDAQEKPQ